MCHLTGNDTLLHSWSSLEGSIRMSIMFAGVDRALKNMDVERHIEIVDAIESGDAVQAPRPPCVITWHGAAVFWSTGRPRALSWCDAVNTDTPLRRSRPPRRRSATDDSGSVNASTMHPARPTDGNHRAPSVSAEALAIA